MSSRMNYSAASGGALADVIDLWHTEDDVKSIASKDYDFSAENAIFEDGWFEGIMSTDSDYEEKLEFMNYITKANWL